MVKYKHVINPETLCLAEFSWPVQSIRPVNDIRSTQQQPQRIITFAFLVLFRTSTAGLGRTLNQSPMLNAFSVCYFSFSLYLSQSSCLARLDIAVVGTES